jgi:hypothetical protein
MKQRREAIFGWSGLPPKARGQATNSGSQRTSTFHIDSSAPGRIRTCDLRIRSPLLYPAELQGQMGGRTVIPDRRAERHRDRPPRDAGRGFRPAASPTFSCASAELSAICRSLVISMTKTITLTLAAVLAALALVPSAASARVNIRIGIGDQQTKMFDQSAFKAAKFKRVRYFARWDVMDNPDALREATQYVERARLDGIQVFLHLSTNDLTIKKAKLPSVAAYRSQLRKLVPYFRDLGVRDFGVWNEANHASQPTYRSPARAASFFVEMYRAVHSRCSTCNIVALDVLDQAGVERYMRSFYRALSPTYRSRARLVGIHNYGDVNRNRTTFTRSIIRQARVYNKRSRFWFTETGGIVKFGRNFPCSTSRAAKRLKNMFSLARTYRTSGVERVYIYNFSGAGCDARFDAGLVEPDGTPRAGYRYIRSALSNYLR